MEVIEFLVLNTYIHGIRTARFMKYYRSIVQRYVCVEVNRCQFSHLTFARCVIPIPALLPVISLFSASVVVRNVYDKHLHADSLEPDTLRAGVFLAVALCVGVGLPGGVYQITEARPGRHFTATNTVLPPPRRPPGLAALLRTPPTASAPAHRP